MNRYADGSFQEGAGVATSLGSSLHAESVDSSVPANAAAVRARWRTRTVAGVVMVVASWWDGHH
ncbi:hypothetical protein SCAB_44371 [Streptomyces scabiei 87.22]|uniref:Uncharacterized protein n=1 Tax=Streptomyces scabiei (strain 87.22) TaxID=680198 RepID=C9Z8M5_STRSW|nr:hypothetical protein SCAB_44371 [Streptomyces scabiei 87.22]